MKGKLKKKQSVSSGNIRKIDCENPSLDCLREAVALLRKGGLVVFPTDTFYGVGADPLCPEAIKRIYRIKKREVSKPILIVIPNSHQLETLTTDVSEQARSLIKQFWPGPLTLLFSAHPALPSILVGETGKVGIRIPDHPVALALLHQWGGALTATSANLSGESSPVTTQAMRQSIRTDVDLILDAGPTVGGQESTIVDLTLKPPRLIRKGRIPFGKIMETLGLTLTDDHDW